MIKKIGYTLGGIAIASTLLIGWNTMSSYVRTSARIAATTAQDAMPVGFEIQRLQTLISDLDGIMAEQHGKLVGQEVDLEYLQQGVAHARSHKNDLASEITHARRLLSEKKDSYTIGGTVYSYDQVVREATAKASNLVRARSLYDAKAQTAESLHSALAQANAQLRQAKDQRETYALRLTQLEATAENIAIRSQLITSLDTLPSAINSNSFQEVENNFKRLERELTIQQRALDEQYKSVPRNDGIIFNQSEEKDVLGILDAALGTSDNAATSNSTQSDSAALAQQSLPILSPALSPIQ